MSAYRPEVKPWRDDRQYTALPPVQWLAPAQLLDSGLRAAISKTFGDYSDRRETFAILNPRAGAEANLLERAGFFTEGGDDGQGDFWIDYVSDVGDGFNATFAVAEKLAADSLVVEGQELCRGRFLVMGGDEVYPTPGEEAYLSRTVGPYETALQYLHPIEKDGQVTNPLRLYAVPGNHDWYDGLSAFLKQFCAGQWIGAWQTRQHRSYFAVKLPRNWWLWGVDTAFDAPIDAAQMEYFRRAGKELAPGDGVILCTAKPTWIACGVPDEAGVADAPYANLRYFVSKVVAPNKASVRLMLAGDKHYYARFEQLTSAGEPAEDGVQKIVAGGGGAYLSGTSDLDPLIAVRETLDRDCPPTKYGLAEAWPDARTSTRLGWTALWRVPRTWTLVLSFGLTYYLIAYLFVLGAADIVASGRSETVRRVGEEGIDGAFVRLLEDGLSFTALWILAILLTIGFVALANKGAGGSPWPGAALGVLHTFLHLGAALFTTALAAWLAAEHNGAIVLVMAGALLVVFGYWLAHRDRRTGTGLLVGVAALGLVWILIALTGDAYWRSLAVFSLTVLLVGSALGTLVLTLYLIGSSYMKRNLNELFVGIGWEGYKNFLRLRIDASGTLHVYALGLKKVHRRTLAWENNLPDVGGRSAEVRLIDSITITRKQP